MNEETHKEFVAALDEKERTWIKICKDAERGLQELYDILEARLSNGPQYKVIIKQVNTDKTIVSGLLNYEKEHGVNLVDYIG